MSSSTHTSSPILRQAAAVAAVVVLAAACGGQGPVIGVPSGATVDSAPLERTVVEGAPLASGAAYRVSGILQDIDVLFTAPSTPVYGLSSRRRVGVSADPGGQQPLVAVLPMRAALWILRTVARW